MKRFMTTKMAMSVLIIAVAMAMVGMGTFAVFSDTETSVGNVFGAGTLDLTPDHDGSAVFNLADLAPGWSDTATQIVTNSGTIDGTLTLSLANLVNNDNGCNDPESDVDGTCGDPGAGEGELGANMVVEISVDGSVVYTGTLDGAAAWSYTGSLAAGASATIAVTASIDSGVGNIIQSDSATFDINASLMQA